MTDSPESLIVTGSVFEQIKASRILILLSGATTPIYLGDIASVSGGGVVAVAAAGTTQGTATQVAFGTVIVTSTTAAVADPWGGIQLPPGIGQVVVVNTTPDLIRVYPPTSGTIDTEAANAPVLVAAAAGGSNGTATFAAPISGTYYSR